MTTVVMTGGTSGLGAHAAGHLRAAGCRVVLGSRGPGPAGGAEAVALDLASLRSVRSFAEQVRGRVGDRQIDALVLNAGTVRPDAAGRSPDGHETTFAVNYLAHYLLVRLLWDCLADRAVIVLTTSGTHDPATRAGLEPPRHARAPLLANPDRDPDAEQHTSRGGEHAYTAAKLCIIMAARTFAARSADRERHLTVLAYCPGQVFGTGLAVNLSRPRRIAWQVMGTPLSAPLRRFVPTLNSRQTAGSTLGRLALGQITPPTGQTYAALRRGRVTWPDPSALARDEAAAESLWADSAELVGLAP